ncbi:hypothetical protein [Labrys sp. WJW]|uniref:hypothetical protein n=1 Tax=Labrys sp. WJW TaxID=1737983 RepID=UPI0012EA1582|nr:hypothetical protein [Labrys sp. WJW]
MRLSNVRSIFWGVAFSAALVSYAQAGKSATDRWVSCMLGEVLVQKHHGARQEAASAAAYKRCKGIKLPDDNESEGASDYVNSQIDRIYAE